jgi:hypothetical protein
MLVPMPTSPAGTFIVCQPASSRMDCRTSDIRQSRCSAEGRLSCATFCRERMQQDTHKMETRSFHRRVRVASAAR